MLIKISYLFGYLLVGVLSVFAGLGLLEIFRVKKDKSNILLAPIITLAFLSVVLGFTVLLGFPIKQSALFIWLILLVLGFIPLLHGREYLTSKTNQEYLLLFLSLILPIALMAAYFWHGLSGYLGSNYPDGWSYISYGRYLWKFSRGIEGGLPPLYQYAAHLNSTRFISSAFLALLSFFKKGDTQSVATLFQAWVIFIISCSIAYFSNSVFTKKYVNLAYVLAVVFSGWIFNSIWVNNFDQLLALGYLPIMVAVIQKERINKWNWGLVFGLLIAGLIYDYPEMSIFIFWGVLLVLIVRIYNEKQNKKILYLISAISILIATVLIAPYLKEYITFIGSQLNITRTIVRPGEGMFPGVLSLGSQPSAFWGLGSEWGIEYLKLKQNIFAFIISFFAVVGLIKLTLRKQILVLVWLSTIALAFFMLFHSRYSYGAYKFIVFSWWGLVYFVFAGYEQLLNFAKNKKARAVFTAFGFVLVAIFCISTSAHVIAAVKISKMSLSANKQIDKYKQVENVKKLVGNKKIALAVDDWLANEWALYYLCDSHLNITTPRAYVAQPHLASYIDRAAYQGVKDMRYFLTDKRYERINNFGVYGRLIWSNDIYRLWHINQNNWGFVVNLEGEQANLEFSANNYFIWQGKQTKFIYLSANNVDAKMVLVLTPGPGYPDNKRIVSVSNMDSLVKKLSFRKETKFEIPLRFIKGKNTVTINTEYPKKASRFLNGDSRELLVKIINPVFIKIRKGKI